MAYLLSSSLHEGFAARVEKYVRQFVGELRDPAAASGEKFPLIIHATGGTTPSAVELVSRTGARGAVLVGFGEHNSFASLLHTKAELEAMGLPVAAFHCPSYKECGDVLARAKKVAEAASALVGARAVLIGNETPQAKILRERFGWSVEVVPLDRFEGLVDSSPPDGGAVEAFGDVQIAKIAAALREIGRGADLVAIHCFPFLMKRRLTPCLALALLNSRGGLAACEGDLASGFAMLMSRRLTGYSGWIANVVRGSGREAVFAHCTISLDMVKSWRVMPHFESGYPHGLSGELREAVYTVVSVAPRFNRAAVGVAEVVKSGNFMQEACRTQAAVKFSRDLRLEAEAPANHHVFMPGDVAEEAEAVFKLLSIPTTRY
ncbi:MAG: fucose isomerase [Pyrobaculum sp.]